VIDMFGGAALAADEMLGWLADPACSEPVLYDNLDQGWALRVLLEPDDVVVLDWNWEMPLSEQTVRAIRLSRAEMARQAEAARGRLRALHAFLVAEIGLDLWNTPARVAAPRRSAWGRLRDAIATRVQGMR
jgi:hypothetical protein